MILTPATLFCHIPKDKLVYCMEFPELIYTSREEAIGDCLPEEETVTLEVAFERIRSDIHHDS